MGEISNKIKHFMILSEEFKNQQESIEHDIKSAVYNKRDKELITELISTFIDITYNSKDEIEALIKRYQSKIEVKKKEDPNFKPQYNLDINEYYNLKKSAINDLEIYESKKVFGLFGGRISSRLLEQIENINTKEELEKSKNMIQKAVYITAGIISFSVLFRIILDILVMGENIVN